MPLEVEIHALAKFLGPEQSLEHPHQLGAFLVNGRRVEIVDLAVYGRAHRMRERPRVFLELVRTQSAHIRDALDRTRAHLCRELLVAKYGKALFEAELKPVAAGDAVAGPVVEIFMRDDRFDALEVG